MRRLGRSASHAVSGVSAAGRLSRQKLPSLPSRKSPRMRLAARSTSPVVCLSATACRYSAPDMPRGERRKRASSASMRRPATGPLRRSCSTKSAATRLVV